MVFAIWSVAWSGRLIVGSGIWLGWFSGWSFEFSEGEHNRPA